MKIEVLKTNFLQPKKKYSKRINASKSIIHYIIPNEVLVNKKMCVSPNRNKL